MACVLQSKQPYKNAKKKMMRKLLSATFTISIVLLLMYFIYNKHYIEYNACYKFPMLKTSFYPDAYKFINTREDFKNILN